MWAGLGAPCWRGVCPVALATTGQWWRMTFSDQRTVYRDQEVETHLSHKPIGIFRHFLGPLGPWSTWGPGRKVLGPSRSLHPFPLSPRVLPGTGVLRSLPWLQPAPPAITLLPV